MARILIIDDDPPLRRALRTSFAARGHDVVEAATGEAGVVEVADHGPDLVVLDLGLPDIDGAEVLERIRGFSEVPIIVLTAADAQAQKVRALDAGADDYVTKPFDPAELLARIRASLRRTTGFRSDQAVIERGAVRIDLARKILTVDDDVVSLTKTEWRLLELLATNPSRLLTHQYLLQTVWGPEYGTESNYLRTFVGQLRKKLRDDAARPTFIATEPGIGYRWIAADGG
ncbi:MAG: response regulator transcription factor [Acidimicrobiales bacterium]